MKRLLTISASALVLAAVFVAPAMAYEELDVVSHEAKAGGFIGLGLISRPDYEGSDYNTTTAAPFGTYRWASGRFFSLGGAGGSETAARFRLNLITEKSSKTWTMGPLLQYRLKRDDDVDDNQVKRMKEADAATELGGFVAFRSGAWSGDLSFAGDVSDNHDGYLIYLKGAYDLLQGAKTRLVLGANTTWADSNYMDTYFGVNASNVSNSGLPLYKAESGFKNAGLSLTGLYHFNKSWATAVNVSYTRMLGDAEDSPLVEGNQGVGSKDQVNAILAVLYTF